MKPLKIALCQIAPARDPDRTMEHALEMIGEAADRGADIVVLPELFYSPYELKAIKKIGDTSRFLRQFSATTKQHGIYLCTGSLAVKTSTGLTNTAFLMNPSGKTVLSYSKCHLFDVSLKKVHVKESAVFLPGKSIHTVVTGLARVGMLICYDIRFPEMARKLALAGAELILVPAVFNTVTGPAHWHVLHRARAIENQVFVAAVSQARVPRVRSSRYAAYGHSLVVSPWGEVLAEAGTGEEIVYADLDPEILQRTRKQLPLLRHRKESLY
jgi:omega-amidase